jgi:uncharacterized protein (DUF2236 family)
MENAIRGLFTETYHRFCRWHMLKKYRDSLNQMYDQHAKLKDRLTSVINHPLTPAEFEGAWKAMLDEFNLHERSALQALYNDRESWIGAYFKEIFCGTMQSTQRSESVNSLVKGGYMDNSTSVHEFAKRFLDVLEHMKENEARNKYHEQVQFRTLHGIADRMKSVFEMAYLEGIDNC